ncbi:hypothetical protein EVI01_02100 [Enterococcus villorum]|uniref:Uncharacterized protein n=2 Tax=Enterococcus villorum TaxID=112904 RepID=A0A511IZQ5_9ENTE|nr:hypothetical protein UAO_01174 [Enterococcus villorum ATCC 700913]EOW78162.1 hypothetical protein I591_01017 [Enterococcus villorum ATCC 700913]GEL90873.1 hypothetical protein EVI01_02100 [Enterococcus villorum]
MKDKIDLFYKKHPYLTLLINLLLGSIIGISVEYLLNKDFIGSGFYTVLFLSLLEAFSIYRKSKKINNFKVPFIRRDFEVAYSRQQIILDWLYFLILVILFFLILVPPGSHESFILFYFV